MNRKMNAARRRRRALALASALAALLVATPARASVGDAVLALLAASRGEGASGAALADQALDLLKAAVGVPTASTERASVGAGGAEAHGRSEFPSISADGRFVAFGADAANLVPGDGNGVFDVFLRDRGLPVP